MSHSIWNVIIGRCFPEHEQVRNPSSNWIGLCWNILHFVSSSTANTVNRWTELWESPKLYSAFVALWKYLVDLQQSWYSLSLHLSTEWQKAALVKEGVTGYRFNLSIFWLRWRSSTIIVAIRSISTEQSNSYGSSEGSLNLIILFWFPCRRQNIFICLLKECLGSIVIIKRTAVWLLVFLLLYMLLLWPRGKQWPGL